MNAIKLLKKALEQDYAYLYSLRDDIKLAKNHIVNELLKCGINNKNSDCCNEEYNVANKDLADVEALIFHRNLQLDCLPLYEAVEIGYDDVENILFPTDYPETLCKKI